MPNNIPVKFSILMAAYNTELYINDAIQSILDQREVSLELIVVDDASTDSTASIIRDLSKKDARIKPIYNDSNEGQNESLNRALSVATGQYISFFDADDIALPSKLKDSEEFLLKSESDLVGSWALQFKGSPFRKAGTARFASSHDEISVASLFKSEVLLGTVLVKKSKLDEINFRFSPRGESYADWELSAEISKVGRVSNLQKATMIYRMHDSSITHGLVAKDVLGSIAANYRKKLLEEMGVTVSDSELMLHLAVSPCIYWKVGQHPYFKEVTFNLKNELIAWRSKLLEANLKSNRFNQAFLRDYIDWVIEAAVNESRAVI